MKSWLPRCRYVHNKSCTAPGEAAKRRPQIRVIDTVERKVIIASPDCLYAALSYVWGTKCDHVKLEDHHIRKDQFGHEFANLADLA